MTRFQADSPTVALPRHPTLSTAYLARNARRQFPAVCRGIDLTFTYDGQGALYQVFSALKQKGRRYALLPAFHCPTVVEPAIRAGLEPRFYRVKEDLSIDRRSFEDGLDNRVAAALVIGYFGFPPDISAIEAQCRESRVVLVEDSAHSFLNANPTRLSGDRGDLAIYSFKKIVPSQVGGAIRKNSQEHAMDIRLNRPAIADSLSNVKRMLHDAFLYSSNAGVKSLFNGLSRTRSFLRGSITHANETSDVRQGRTLRFDYPFRTSWASSKIPWFAMQVLNASALDSLVEARRANYRILDKRLTGVRQVQPAFPALGDSVCPWSFPVLMRNRSSYDHELQSLGVPLFTFGETLHPTLLDGTGAASDTIDTARFLSSRMLCFSIHQGISNNQQDSLADLIVEYFD